MQDVYRRIPQTGAPNGEIVCPPYPTHPDLMAWPESPAPFEELDRAFERRSKTRLRRRCTRRWWWATLAGRADAGQREAGDYYNSALIVGRGRREVGRYDKIHLVPFGEYVPFQNLLKFARKLTGRVSKFSRGERRKVFLLNGHRYGVFICYESVFADEVRQFAKNGAEVLVNISDDGWYGDTSAPWQHLNMVRMRASKTGAGFCATPTTASRA
jgi:apolipoprotein N-acyltransferase